MFSPSNSSKPTSNSSGVSPLCQRLKQYKVSTPPWKDSFRQNCFKRLRDNRQRLVDRYRNTGELGASDIVAQEVSGLKQNSVLTDSELELYLHVYEEIQRELEVEERNWADYMMQLNEQQLGAEIDSYYEDGVMCVQCLRAQLTVSPTSTSCPNPDCSFVYHNSHVNIDSALLRNRFGSILEEHQSTGCASHLQWVTDATCNLSAICECCSFTRSVF